MGNLTGDRNWLRFWWCKIRNYDTYKMNKYKKGDYEFRLYTYELNDLTDKLSYMMNSCNQWEAFKIFEPVNDKVTVLFRLKY